MTVENDRVSRYNSVVIAQRLGQTFNLGSLVFSQNKQTNKQKKKNGRVTEMMCGEGPRVIGLECYYLLKWALSLEGILYL